MPWVNRTGYNQGSRHWVPGVVRTFTNVTTRGDYEYRHFVDSATGPMLHNQDFLDRYPTHVPTYWTEPGYICINMVTGKEQHKSGGFSVKESVNLMQRNICRACTKKFLKEVRPDLGAAYEALRKGEVIG